MPELILASNSPRRQELLDQIGVPYGVHGVDIDESVLPAESACAYVERLAIAKAKTAAQCCKFDKAAFGRDIVVLGSDTTVVYDGQILGKPSDKQQAIEMLMSLSGRQHKVMTAIALVQGERLLSSVVTTDVYFRTLTIDECRNYWDTGEPQDKAGSYGIQGLGAVFVDHINGSYSAVVGLPLRETAELLQQLGIACWQA